VCFPFFFSLLLRSVVFSLPISVPLASLLVYCIGFIRASSSLDLIKIPSLLSLVVVCSSSLVFCKWNSHFESASQGVVFFPLLFFYVYLCLPRCFPRCSVPPRTESSGFPAPFCSIEQQFPSSAFPCLRVQSGRLAFPLLSLTSCIFGSPRNRRPPPFLGVRSLFSPTL